jgi:hypothetical protein
VKITLITATAMLLLSGSMVLAQNAGTGTTTSSGDSAVSPTTGNPVATTGIDARPSPGAGVNSGTLNNGTTGDTIGTGPGTTNRTPDGQGATAAGGGRKE